MLIDHQTANSDVSTKLCPEAFTVFKIRLGEGAYVRVQFDARSVETDGSETYLDL